MAVTYRSEYRNIGSSLENASSVGRYIIRPLHHCPAPGVLQATIKY